ncbi:MAG TPA: hypothetical protein VJR23_14595 [Candidatus Acidoferrales bacterium]|nr:hypothetical protein [Candidatus Acidoferrales bacterium]
MRGMNFNAGLRGGLFDARHFGKMGAAVWLYGWLVLRQTHQTGETGWVLGGTPVNYREIEEETGFNRRTLERWMRTLRRHGYVITQASPAGIVIRITKAKKFPQDRALFHSFSTASADKSAEALRQNAGATTQPSVANRAEHLLNQSLAARIDSSSVERKIENQNPLPLRKNRNPETTPEAAATNHFLTPKQFLREARLRLQLLRAEREEAVRRELMVGAGPEVRRS